MWQEVIGLRCLLQEVTVEAREEDGIVKERVLVEKQKEEWPEKNAVFGGGICTLQHFPGLYSNVC